QVISAYQESRSKRAVPTKPTPSWTSQLCSPAAQEEQSNQQAQERRPGQLHPAQLPCHSWEKLAVQVAQGKRKSRTERPKVVRGDRLACHRTLVDLILNALANRGEPSRSTIDRRGRQIHRSHTLRLPESREHLGLVEVESIPAQADFRSGKYVIQDQDLGSWKLLEVIARHSERTLVDKNLNAWPSLKSETESIELRRIHSKPSQSNSIASESSLSRDRIRFVSAETKSDQSLPRVSQHSTLDMENNDRTLKELATPDVAYQPWCIQYPQLEPAHTYELKSGLIHLLPKFHGLVGEDPHKHLKEFHVVCSTMRPQGIPEDYIKMKVFPFSLDGAAKDWLYLQPVLFNTWGDMKRMFLEKFSLASRTATIRKEICGIRQNSGETLHEY
ncbi:hypothetical protein CR513_25137, partial [Mucuna pruriens]